MEERTIRAIHENDLDEFLDSIGLLEKIRSGLVICAKCSNPVTLKTFDSIGRFSGVLKIFCNRLECKHKWSGDANAD